LSAPIGAMANQIDRYGRVNQVPPSVHEVPAFVCERIEVIRDVVSAHPLGTVGPSGSKSVAREKVLVPDSRDLTCACLDPKPGSALPYCLSGWPAL
jgi:hypothetical protein